MQVAVDAPRASGERVSPSTRCPAATGGRHRPPRAPCAPSWPARPCHPIAIAINSRDPQRLPFMLAGQPGRRTHRTGLPYWPTRGHMQTYTEPHKPTLTHTNTNSNTRKVQHKTMHARMRRGCGSSGPWRAGRKHQHLRLKKKKLPQRLKPGLFATRILANTRNGGRPVRRPRPRCLAA